MTEAGVPELIKSQGPLPAAVLAERLGLNSAALRRTMRALSVYEVFVEDPDEVYGLTDLGRSLCQAAPGTAQASALLVGREIGDAWTQYGHTLRTGEPAFELVHGAGFFEYAAAEPCLEMNFQRSQAAGLELDIAGILRCLPSGSRTVVDVGGGDGVLLEHILRRDHSAHGVLLETSGIAARARGRMMAAGLSSRCTIVCGDFMRAVPEGGDLYLLRQVLHDWDDARSRKILANCRSAMAPGASLVIIDIVRSEQRGAAKDSRMAAVMDLYMLTIFGGQERTADEFCGLLEETGFCQKAIDTVNGHMSLIQATAS